MFDLTKLIAYLQKINDKDALDHGYIRFTSIRKVVISFDEYFNITITPKDLQEQDK